MYNNYNSHYNSYYGSGSGGPGAGSNPGTSSVMSRMNESEALALLQHLDKDDLQHLLNDDSKLNDLIQDLQQVRQIQSGHDDLVAQNKSLAEYNLTLQPRLDTLKTQVAKAYETTNKLKVELGINKAQLDNYVSEQKLDTIHALLQTEAAKAEEESEVLADSFCEKNLGVEEFLAEYLAQRTLAHKRKIKAEKLGELLRDPHSSSSLPPPSWPTSAPNVPPPQRSAPYPIGPPQGGAPYPLGGPSYSMQHDSSGYGMPAPGLYRK